MRTSRRPGQIAWKRRALEKRQSLDREKLRESLTDFRLREERERTKVTKTLVTRSFAVGLLVYYDESHGAAFCCCRSCFVALNYGGVQDIPCPTGYLHTLGKTALACVSSLEIELSGLLHSVVKHVKGFARQSGGSKRSAAIPSDVCEHYGR